LYYRVCGWLPGQIAAVVGIVFWFVLLAAVDLPDLDSELKEVADRVLERVDLDAESIVTFRFLRAIELFAVATFALQFFAGAVLLVLSWELRWYMVGDQCLRLREGLWSVREQTMTIKNVQNLSLRQGPIQKLFGIADLEVHTAGGGASSKPDNGGEEGGRPLHVGVFRGLTLADAQSLRDRIRERLALHRGAGLGDADEEDEAPPAGPADSEDLGAAARELLEESRALRRTVGEKGV
jgi:uncharacterized membrane protein YdbT with pleckstrin-like domain